MPIGKEKIKLPLLVDHMILNVGEPKRLSPFTKRLLELIREFVEYQITAMNTEVC